MPNAEVSPVLLNTLLPLASCTSMTALRPASGLSPAFASERVRMRIFCPGWYIGLSLVSSTRNERFSCTVCSTVLNSSSISFARSLYLPSARSSGTCLSACAKPFSSVLVLTCHTLLPSSEIRLISIPVFAAGCSVSLLRTYTRAATRVSGVKFAGANKYTCPALGFNLSS